MKNPNNMTKEEARAFLRCVMGPPKRELDEQERTELWIILKLVHPNSESNNQHTMTEVYRVGGKEYHVHYGLYDYPMIEEILPDDT